jgi:hypothetical protein
MGKSSALSGRADFKLPTSQAKAWAKFSNPPRRVNPTGSWVKFSRPFGPHTNFLSLTAVSHLPTPDS